MIHKKKYILSVLFLSIFLFSCNTQKETILEPQTELVIGTVCTINLFEDGTEDLYSTLFDQLSDIENKMSVNIATSEIALANQNAGIKPVEISYETYEIIEASIDIANITNGAFNPAIGPLVKIWAIGTDAARIPTQEEITEAINLCDWKNIELEKKDNVYSVFLTKKGMSLDLGGVAKGFAADSIRSILTENNVQKAMIDLGGNVFAYGEKAENTPWRIGIKNPFNSTGSPIIALSLTDTSVVTSGVYERFFENNGVRYHHLLNSNTGYPENNNLLSVSIVSESSMLADILSTAVFVLGLEEGMSLLEEQKIQGFCITNEKEIITTGNSFNLVEVLDSDFTKTIFER